MSFQEIIPQGWQDVLGHARPASSFWPGPYTRKVGSRARTNTATFLRGRARAPRSTGHSRRYVSNPPAPDATGRYRTTYPNLHAASFTSFSGDFSSSRPLGLQRFQVPRSSPGLRRHEARGPRDVEESSRGTNWRIAHDRASGAGVARFGRRDGDTLVHYFQQVGGHRLQGPEAAEG